MRYFVLILIFYVTILAGCSNENLWDDFVSSDQKLEALYGDYFYVANNSESSEELAINLASAQELANKLEAQQSEHAQDFRYVTNLLEMANLIQKADDPQKMADYLRVRIHPSRNDKFMVHYQRAQAPPTFLYKSYESQLDDALMSVERSSEVGRFYSQWVELKNFSTYDAIKEKTARDLNKGYCRGFAEYANELMCKDHTQSPGDLMQKINSNLAFSFKRQICYNIINKLINATNSHDAKTYMSDVQEKYNFKARVLGLRLSADIKSYMRNFLREPLTQGGYFRARVSFRGSKFCHALAIQILDKKEFRIIENNSGVLIFDTEEEFLEAFVFYRRYYYYKNKHASMLIFGDYCN